MVIALPSLGAQPRPPLGLLYLNRTVFGGEPRFPGDQSSLSRHAPALLRPRCDRALLCPRGEMPLEGSQDVPVESLSELLLHDSSVKLAGVDVDGQLRGKLVSKKKFLSVAKDGFGFCSVIFGWDMHDLTYFKELKISNKENGYHDIIAVPDLSTFRRIPWEDNVPFYLVSFYDPDTRKPLSACPRGLLKAASEKLEAHGFRAMAGGDQLCLRLLSSRANVSNTAEYEFFHFRAPQTIPNAPVSERNNSSTAGFLRENPVDSLPSLTQGMFGYSLTRPVHNQDYYYGVFDACERFNTNLEGWHTESGPGVFEAALAFGEIREMADKAGLFK